MRPIRHARKEPQSSSLEHCGSMTGINATLIGFMQRATTSKAFGIRRGDWPDRKQYFSN